MQTQVNTVFFDRRIEERSKQMSDIQMLKKAGVSYHADFCDEKVQTIGHALIAAKADILRAENAKELFKKGVPFGIAISAGNRNATEIIEFDPRELELHGKIMSEDKQKKGFFICVDGRVIETSEYIVVLSNGEYSLLKLINSL